MPGPCQVVLGAGPQVCTGSPRPGPVGRHVPPVGLRHNGGQPNRVRRRPSQRADRPRVEPEEGARVVLHVLAAHMSTGEIEDMEQLLPQDLKALWE